jgi:(S)-mandelate dehydrogenase
MVFDFVDGGSQSETTLQSNRGAFDRFRLLGSAPVNVEHRSTGIELFDLAAGMPVIVGPTGGAGALWPEGDIALARAAAKFQVPFVISNATSATLEALARAGGRLWLQIFLPSSRARALSLLQEAAGLGIEAIEVTVDTAVPGRRIRDLANRFSLPLAWSLPKLFDVLTHPRWLMRTIPHGPPMPILMSPDRGTFQTWTTPSAFAASYISAAIDWEDLKWLRDHWRGRLIVKGIQDPKHVLEAITAGYDALVVSNHGGRQLDGGVATIDILPEIVALAEKRIPILIDGGFRSGTDVLKALALGASAVQLGRSTLYGLAVAGQAGVERALEILHLEFDTALALTGLNTPTQASSAMIRMRP